MASSDEVPTGAGRPSLLSAAQQAEADKSRILSNLQRTPAVASVRTRGRRMALWGGAGLGVLAVVGAAVAWLAADGEEEMAGKIEAVPVSTTVASAAAASTAAASAPATIHDEVVIEPHTSLKDMLNAAPASDKHMSLKDMLSAKPSPKADAGVLSKALESPSATTHIAAQAPAKAASKPEPHAHSKPVQGKRAEPDSDVTLLAALVAHEQAHPSTKKGPPLPLKACRQLNGAEAAEDCRLRACAKRPKTDPECRAHDKVGSSL